LQIAGGVQSGPRAPSHAAPSVAASTHTSLPFTRVHDDDAAQIVGVMVELQSCPGLTTGTGAHRRAIGSQ
jgi:hypothetical protein